MKKLMSLILVLMLACTMIACSAPAASKPAEAPAPEAPAAQAPPEAPADISWPERTIEVVIPANPGGDTDINIRLIAKYLEKYLGQSVVVVNMAGASGGLAYQDVMDAGTDGNKFLFYHSGSAISEIMGMYSFDVLEEFTLIDIPVLDETNAFIANADSQFTDIPALIEYMKANPGKVSFATETGSFTHLHVLAFEKATGTKFNIVDAGTASEKTAALLGKKLDIMGNMYGSVKDYVTNGDFRALCMLSEERLPGAPAVPTLKEYGYDVVFDKFFFMAAVKGTDQAIVDKMSIALKAVSQDPEYIAEAAVTMVTPNFLSEADANAYYAAQKDVYATYLTEFAD